VLADVVVVDSRDAALDAIRSSIPDVLLLSALLSPRDEDEFNAHHLQTHTIPQLASALAPGEKRSGGGLFSSFRKKKDPEPVVVGGCDPDLFAEEIRTYLQRAETKKRELQDSNGMAPDMRLGPMSERSTMPQVAESEPEPAGASSSWDDPFAWKPSGTSTRAAAPAPAPAAEPAVPAFDSIFKPEAEAEPLADLSFEPAAAAKDEPLIFPPAAEPPVSRDEPLVKRAAEEPIGEPITAFVDGQPVVMVKGEPSLLISQPYSVMKPVADVADAAVEPSPEPEAEAEPLLAAPHRRHELIDTGDAENLPEITLVEDPVETAEPLVAAPYASPATLADTAGETLINLDAEPYEASIEEPYSHGRSEDVPDDSGFGEWKLALDESPSIVDGAAGINRLGPLATWARTEPRRTESPSSGDDLRMMLGGLAVPAAVAGVRYPRGVRIRRVRVPATRTNDSGDSVGPVILSRKRLAERREAAAS
jgi:hypothetical protein